MSDYDRIAEAISVIARVDCQPTLQEIAGHLELYSLEAGQAGFFSAIQESPVEFLAMQPLLQFQGDGGSLHAGLVHP